MWSSVPCPIIIPCVHGPPCSFHNAAVDPISRNGIFLWMHVPWLTWGCLLESTIRLITLLLNNTNCLLNLVSMPLVILLYRTRPGLRSSAQLSADLIWNKAMYMSALVSNSFHGSFDKFYAFFYLSVTLMVVWWWYSMMYAVTCRHLNEVFACIWHYLAERSVLWKNKLTCL